MLTPTLGWPSAVGIALHLADLVLGGLLLVLPWRRALLIPLAITFPLATLASPERVSSHSSLMIGALAVVLVFALAEIAERAGGRAPAGAAATDWYGWTLLGLRWLCALTYAFAAFHKLNSTFLSAATSPAPPFLLRVSQTLGVPGGAAPFLAPVAIYGAVATEAALPLLLLGRRTRPVGCLLGATFHLIMMARGIMDFPLVILAFYPLFMTIDEARALVARCRARPSPARLVGAVAIAGVGAATLASSVYVRNLHTGSEPPMTWVHGALLYATFFGSAYVIATVGASLLGHRPDGTASAMVTRA